MAEQRQILFQNAHLEKLTLVHPSVPALIFLPVLAYLAIAIGPLNAGCIGYTVFGYATWTLFEYLMHRFVFHMKPWGHWSSRVLFLFHGVHHAEPHDPLRLVMPPSVSVPIGLLTAFLVSQLMTGIHTKGFLFGFYGGYLIYDLGHYAIHHLHFKSKLFKRMREHHLRHHFQDAHRNFGVSTTFWENFFERRAP